MEFQEYTHSIHADSESLSLEKTRNNKNFKRSNSRFYSNKILPNDLLVYNGSESSSVYNS